MCVDLESIVPMELLRTDLDYVLCLVQKKGRVVLINENRPVLVLAECALWTDSTPKTEPDNAKPMTLHEAMRVVLMDAPERMLHVAQLAEEIYNRRLYTKKDGNKADYPQLRARCSHYPEMFEVLPKNNVRLREHLPPTR